MNNLRRLVQPVTAYVWNPTGAEISQLHVPLMVRKECYWDGSLKEIDGKRYIVVGVGYESCREPDAELLACGHEQPVRSRGGKKFYNNSRRCDQCAAEAFFTQGVQA